MTWREFGPIAGVQQHNIHFIEQDTKIQRAQATMKAFSNLKSKVDAIRHPSGQGQEQAPLQSTPTSSSSQNKRGLCWPLENNNNNDPIFPFTKPGSKISWIYNWSPNPSPDASSLQWVPMQWNLDGIDDLGSKARDSGARAILGPNEPELPDQSNISAEQAANEWVRAMEPIRKSGIRCGSPGISNAGHAVGWLQDFLKRIREEGSDVDFYCFHWYGVDLGGFYDYIWSTYVLFPTHARLSS